MGVQIIPERGIGENLGSAFGTGLQQALGMLAKQKLAGLTKQNEQRQYASQIYPFVSRLPGMTQQKASEISNFMSALHPSERKNVWGNLSSFMGQSQQGAQPQQGAQLGAQSEMPGEPQFSPQQQDQSAFLSKMGVKPYGTQLDLSGLQGAGVAPQGQQGQQGSQQEQQVSPEMQRFQDLFKGPQEKFQEKTIQLKEKGLAQKEELAKDAQQELRERAMSKELGKLSEKYESANESLNYNKVLRELNNSGQLTQGMTADFWEKTGLPTTMWANSSTELAKKVIEQGIATGAQSIGKARGVGAKLLELLRKSYPTLSNSREGMNLILDSTDAVHNEPAIDAYNIGQGLAEDYEKSGDRIPYNFLGKVHQISETETKKKIEGFIKKVKTATDLAPLANVPYQGTVIGAANGYVGRWNSDKNAYDWFTNKKE